MFFLPLGEVPCSLLLLLLLFLLRLPLPFVPSCLECIYMYTVHTNISVGPGGLLLEQRGFPRRPKYTYIRTCVCTLLYSCVRRPVARSVQTAAGTNSFLGQPVATSVALLNICMVANSFCSCLPVCSIVPESSCALLRLCLPPSLPICSIYCICVAPPLSRFPSRCFGLGTYVHQQQVALFKTNRFSQRGHDK